MIDIERLGEVLERSALKRRNRAVQIGVRGHDDYPHLGMPLLYFIEEREAGLSGHANVGHQDCWLAVSQRLAHLVHRRKRLVSYSLTRERLFEHPADRPIVVDDPDRIHRFTP